MGGHILKMYCFSWMNKEFVGLTSWVGRKSIELYLTGSSVPVSGNGLALHWNLPGCQLLSPLDLEHTSTLRGSEDGTTGRIVVPRFLGT